MYDSGLVAEHGYHQVDVELRNLPATDRSQSNGSPSLLAQRGTRASRRPSSAAFAPRGAVPGQQPPEPGDPFLTCDEEREAMGIQTKCGSTNTRTGRACRKPAMVGYSRCQLHRGEWAPVQVKRRKKRR